MRLPPLALFVSGIFFGGAIDHAILAVMRRDVTPYGVSVGIGGNVLYAAGDLVVAARCCTAFT